MNYSNDKKANQTSKDRDYCSLHCRDNSRPNLQAECEKCFGLCCVALYFSSAEGFPAEKEAGQPCHHLQSGFSCNVHESLMEMGLKGCVAFDCFGAGQKVAQVSFGGNDWMTCPNSAQQMFAVFLIMRQLHELLWYLTEALTLPSASPIHGALSALLNDTERLTQLSPDALVKLDVAAHRAQINPLLLQTSELARLQARHDSKAPGGRQKSLRPGTDLSGADLRRFDLIGANLRGACLIAADLRDTDLSGTDCIGADFRDADIRGANLSRSIFLSQAQINVARGDDSTKLPWPLTRPACWDTSSK